MTALSTLKRPNTVMIFARDFARTGRIQTFLLNNTAVSVPGRVRLDLTKSVAVNRPIAVARSPVEQATADNVRIGQVVVSVTGTLAATPLGVGGALVGSFGSLVRRDLKELDKLIALQESREPVTLVTPQRTYQSMVFSIDEQHPGTNKVDLSLTFHQVRIVAPQLIEALLDLDEALVGAQNTTDLGAQPTEVVDAPVDLNGGLGG
jgi:hypothetical protein